MSSAGGDELKKDEGADKVESEVLKDIVNDAMGNPGGSESVEKDPVKDPLKDLSTESFKEPAKQPAKDKFQQFNEKTTQTGKRAAKSKQNVRSLIDGFDIPGRSKSNPDITLTAPVGDRDKNPFFDDQAQPQPTIFERELAATQRQMTQMIQNLVPLLQERTRPNDLDSSPRPVHLYEEKQVQLFLKEAREQKISFSGPNCDARRFLRQVENLQDFYPMSFQFTVKALQKLMVGAAEDWFVNHRLEFVSWYQFKLLFEKYFVPSDRDAIVRLEICSRKQRADESVTTYMSEVRRKNSELTNPLSREELLSTFKVNLHERFRVHVHLADIFDLNQLEQFCVKIEKAIYLESSEPDVTLSAIDKSTIVCYRCSKKGHFAKECTQSQVVPSAPPQPVPVADMAKVVQDLTEAVRSLQLQVEELKKQKN